MRDRVALVPWLLCSSWSKHMCKHCKNVCACGVKIGEKYVSYSDGWNTDD